MDTAKRDPHREIVLGTEYDMLIIDEAHKMKNKKTPTTNSLNKFAKNIACFSPPPLCKTILSELYNLITLLKPGQLGGQSEFKTNSS